MTTPTTALAGPIADPSRAGPLRADLLRADLLRIAVAGALGLGLIFVAGFAGAARIHDTAHDQRHAIAFPCH